MVKTDILLAHENQFAGGFLASGTTLFPIVGNTKGPEAKFTITANVAPNLAAQNGGLVSVWTTPGAGEPTPLINPNDQTAIYDYMESKVTRAINRFADAYIEPEYDALNAFDSAGVTPVSHVSSLPQNTFRFVEEYRGTWPGGPPRSKNYETPAFWAVQVVTGYEYAREQDKDPETEEHDGGLTGGAKNGLWPRSIVFLETVRDMTRDAEEVHPDTTHKMLVARVGVHEVAHQLLRLNMRDSDPDHPEHRNDVDNIMKSPLGPMIDTAFYFDPLDVALMRETIASP